MSHCPKCGERLAALGYCVQCAARGPNLREHWTVNDDGDPVPRRTAGSIVGGYSDKDFTLVCKLCGDEYGNEPELPVGVIGAHFARHHPEVQTPKGEPRVVLDLLWLGQGPAPKGKP